MAETETGAGLPDYLAGGGLALSGLGGILSLFGDSPQEKAAKLQKQLQQESWQRDDKRRAAQLQYLQQNLGQFQDPNYQFDPAQHSDILDPIKSQQGQQLQGVARMMGLSGTTGGIRDAKISNLARGQGRELSRTMTGLARTGEEKAYQRAMQKYMADVQRTQAIASAVG